MNRISLRTLYVGAEPTLRGRTGWAHWLVNTVGEAGEFQADDGTRIPCKVQDVTVWLDGSGTANAA